MTASKKETLHHDISPSFCNKKFDEFQTISLVQAVSLHLHDRMVSGLHPVKIEYQW